MGREKLKVKGILFDLDGTIVDSKEAYFEASETAFRAIGQRSPRPKTALEIPKRLEQHLSITDLVGSDVKGFLDVYLKTFYSITEAKTKPMCNVQVTLEMLSIKAKLALITMRFVEKKALIKELTHFGLAQFFTVVVTGKDNHKPKPSPEALIKTIKALDVNMCDCVIVGDSVTDVRAGKSAGAMTAAVLSGLFSHEELARESPDLILKDVVELPKLLEFTV